MCKTITIEDDKITISKDSEVYKSIHEVALAEGISDEDAFVKIMNFSIPIVKTIARSLKDENEAKERS